MSKNKNLKVNCPQCEKKFRYYASDFRPFCSERCKMIDLGHWFDESYKVPVKNGHDLQEDELDEKNQADDYI